MELPKAFIEYLLRTMPKETADALIAGLQTEPSVSIRLNPARQGIKIQADGQVPWCPEGFYLKERPVFTADPLLHAGCYYVQEASSMFLSHVLRQLAPSLRQPPRLALDLCAAPGGKSTLLRSLLPDDCVLVSNEPVRNRCQVLAENLAKWGHPNVVVTNAYARDIARLRDTHFDLILADVPCSGEGMMRKEAEAVAQWSPRLVADCAALQRSIIADIWPSLRPGGILIYSTCTFNADEDEDNVAWIARELGAEVVAVPVDPAWGILGDMRKDVASPLPCYHFVPGRVRGEGFFCAVLQKDEDAEMADFIERKAGKEKKRYSKNEHPDTTLPCQQLPTLPTDLLDTPPAETKPGRARPTIAARVGLTLDDAFRYLRGESLVLPSDTPRGMVQVCFEGHRLGLVKNIGSRANNLYPKEWRIKSTHLEPRCVVTTAATRPDQERQGAGV